MYYEVNVSRDGHHLFATHPRSLTDRRKAEALYEELSAKFPKAEGHELSITLWKAVGETVTSTKG